LSLLDRNFRNLVCVLVFFTPLAFGSVYPWAYRIAECVAFVLLALWMLKLGVLAARGDSPAPANAAHRRALGIPLALLLILIAAQIVPLPPRVLRVISPATYDLYSHVYPDWPARAPYADVAVTSGRSPAVMESSETLVLPTIVEVHSGAPIPFAPTARTASAMPASSDAPVVMRPDGFAAYFSGVWRPLSVAWPLTATAFIGALAMASVLLSVCFYPFGTSADDSDSSGFIRAVLLSAMASGVLIAVIALVEVATWNGRIMWMLVPLDWGKPIFGIVGSRARGPFVDPDHMAGYLAMIFPLMLSATIFAGFPVRDRSGPGARLLAGLGVLLIFSAVAMSQSRAGWLGIALGTMLLITLVFIASRRDDEEGRAKVGARALRLSLVVLTAMLVMALFLVGAEGRHQISTRVGNTIVGGGVDLTSRTRNWRRSLTILHQFPAFGVGLGGWPAIFHRFQPPPRGDLYFSRTHNDYLELLAEIGIVGVAILGWFLVSVAIRLKAGFARVPKTMLQAYAALVSALAVIAVIESFDFDLQIPANLFLFMVFMGLALRLSIGETEVVSLGKRPRWPALRLVPAAFALVAGVTVVLVEKGPPFPYSLGLPKSPGDELNQLLRYPTEPEVHMALLNNYAGSMTPALVSHELAAAAWLDPTNPAARDFYARDLTLHGDLSGGDRELADSVYVAPFTESHAYLEPRVVPWLPDDRRRAIEWGLKRAVTDGFEGAAATLGQFLDALDRSSDSASIDLSAAAHEPDPMRRAALLRAAGDAYLRSGELKNAGDVFEEAIDADPRDTTSYVELASRVLAPHDKYDQARQLIIEAEQNGADACKVAIGLAHAAQFRGRADIAETALGETLGDNAASFECTFELGELYASEGRDARAVLVLTDATKLNPDSVSAWLTLANVAERSYDYFTAEKAYDQAERLAPKDTFVTNQVADFRKKMAEPLTAAAGAAQP
jgi:tetratricopeptide (TPR) repeat protein/O-antigen ligase